MNPTLTLNDQGIVTREEWKRDGDYHRVDGPAIRSWMIVNEVTVLVDESWWLQGQLSRVAGPAYREWCVADTPVDGRLVYEGWFLHGKYHRVDGPARREWNAIDRSVVTEEWYLSNVKVDPTYLHRMTSTIIHWLRYHSSKRRERVISSLLAKAGMTVFPGLMGLLRLY